MSLTPYNEKINERTFAINMSKKVPNNSANLAFVSSPKIKQDSVNIVKNNIENINIVKDKSFTLFYANEEGLLETKEGTSIISRENILITDEFTVKKTPDDIPKPLYYVATLKYRIKESTYNLTQNSIPYIYGYYKDRTIQQIKNENTSNDNTDISLLIGDNQQVITDENDVIPITELFSIKTDNGDIITENFKIRLIKDTEYANDAYEVRIYNSFDKNKTYKVTYQNYEEETITEIIKSNTLFNKADSVDEIISSGFDEDESNIERKYAVIKENGYYKIYSPAQLYKITDENRKPRDFRYKILANLENTYSKSQPVQLKVGVYYINNSAYEDVHNLIPSFIHEIGNTFPSYISFINPHPPSKYWKDINSLDSPMDYLGAYDYWDINLSMLQHYVNDYDLIIFTGYGSCELSAYNQTIYNYLMQGGKIVIDNNSNEALEVLDIDFGSSNHIFDYSYDLDLENNPITITGPKNFGTNVDKYIRRYYDLTDINAGKIAYFDDTNMQVCPKVTLSGIDQSNWVDIVKYSSNISIGYTDFNNKGKIYFSNTGLSKSFSQNPNKEVKRFMTNFLITVAEDKWVSTPWIYDRAYHIDQLYEDEMILYMRDIVDNKIVAKKILSNDVTNIVSKYTYGKEFYNYDNSTYYIEAEEYKIPIGKAQKEWVTLTSVDIPNTLESGEKLTARVINPGGNNFSTDDLLGYSLSSISTYNEKITFKFTIRPFTYSWQYDSEKGELVQRKLYGANKHTSIKETTISRGEGLINLGVLTTMLPPLPSGSEWADRGNIFFEIKVGYFQNGFFNMDEQRINLKIYDKLTGEYIYNKNGENVISYNELYSLRNITKETGSTNICRRSEDIVLQAYTNYYVLTANKRTFAIKEKSENTIDIQLPTNLDTNENWHPRIKNISFTKNTFDKNDYVRLEQTLGFKFEKDYILNRMHEYFGENPEDTVLSIIAKLNDDEILDKQDKQIISEAFSLIEQDVIYEYNMNEYHKQPWQPSEPLKNTRNELAKYINRNTIQVQYPHIYVDGDIIDSSIVREKLERISPNIFKATHLNWLPNSSILLEVFDVEWEIIDPSTYTVDFENGIITFSDTESREIFASYDYSTIEITKKLYSNANVWMEELVQLDTYYYDISHNNIIDRIDDINAISPAIYYVDEGLKPRIASPTEYNIDYQRGILKLNHRSTSKIYMNYSYSEIEKLTIKDYDINKGLITLNEDIDFNDNIYVTYYYEDEYYDYKGYIENNKYIYLDLNPTRGHICTILTENDGFITYKDVPTYSLLGETVYLYMLPSKMIKNNEIVAQNEFTLRHTFDKERLSLIQIAHPEIIVLGSIKITNDYTKYDIESLDTRIRGGGIKKDIPEEEIKKTDELSLNFWDLSDLDGRSFYSNGITVIKLPEAVLEKFTENEVKEIVEKHIACGVLPIIKYVKEI